MTVMHFGPPSTSQLPIEAAHGVNGGTEVEQKLELPAASFIAAWMPLKHPGDAIVKQIGVQGAGVQLDLSSA